MAMQSENYLQSVKDQYEALPYPPRDPRRERERLIHKVGDNLIVLNHHCFAGARDFRGGFRALVAGGGTGDAAVYLAEQLRHLGGEVVYLDLSAASMAVARERAAVRGLDNIRWVNDSILAIPALGLGRFDYINCTGVLHHLESTEQGLAVLRDALADDGVLLLMLYGKYGRRAVYDLQGLLRLLLPPELPIPERVRGARSLLGALPPTNSFVRDLPAWEREIAPDGFGDAGLYDLLLHSQDRCFDVPELYALAGGAGLDMLGFVDRAAAYDPLNVLRDPAHLEWLGGLPLPRRQAIAELLVCDLATHEFYLGRPGRHRAACLDDEDNALVMLGAMHGHHADIAAGLTPGRTLTLSGRCGNVVVTGTPVNRVLFGCMDGRTPLREVYARVTAAVPGATREGVAAELAALYRTLHAHGHLYLLRAGSYGTNVPDYSRLPPF